ncbi:MAG TPA: tetratricopeptide repeat protein [Candidatus Koribacter sp.]|jgi:TPR repeat protein
MNCTCRSVLALFLSYSLLSMVCVAQSSARPFAESKYPTALPHAAQQSVQDVVAAAGRASLDFPPDRNDSVALQCDQLADHPSDPQRVGDGVVFEKIQVDQALAACQQAAERQPQRPRYQYLYGRVLNVAERYADAAVEYAAADQAGYGLGSFGLGMLYQDGASGVPQDLGQAQRLFFRAGNAGIADAFTSGAELYLDENPPEYEKSIPWLEHAVQGGSADGFDELGLLYEMGYGMNKDVDKAFNLFNEAAKRGSVEGSYRLGLTYFYGLGVSSDRSAACQWFIRSAAGGYPEAEREAGFCYYNGTGVTQNHQEAFNWFSLAGQARLVDARVIVADMLDRGDGHNQDSKYAVMWYQAAAEQGDVYAMTELGAHLRRGDGVDWSEAQAMQWFAKAAQMGYAPAQTSLAIGYENGLGQSAGQGRQDYQLAAAWFDKAGQQGDDYAELNLGVMYENGWGVSQDIERAKQLYARAAGSSNPTVANLGKQYFADITDRNPRRVAATSSKDSSNLWSVIIVGTLAVGVLAALTSGGSSNSSSTSTTTSSNYTGSTGYTPGVIFSSPAPSTSTAQGKPWETHYTNSNLIPMGNIGAQNVVSTGNRWDRRWER